MRARAVGMAGLCLWLAGSALAQDELVEIAEVRWTRAVDPLTRQPGAALATAPARTPLTLWMRLRAGEAGLARLAADGRLPLRHRWFRESFGGVSAEGLSEMTDSIVLEAGKRELLGRLRREVEARGSFDWRTWSGKARPGPGRWSVAVVYADNTPVLCRGEGAPQPCRYAITVK